MRTRRSASSSSDPVSSSSDKNRRHQSTSRQEVRTPQLNRGNSAGHTPVLLHESIAGLALQADDIVVDATLGGAGHAVAILQHLGPEGMFIGIDADAKAVERTRTAFSALASADGDVRPRVHLVLSNFRKLAEELRNCGVAGIHKAFFDLGWSGYQLAAGRGFSFLADEPLLMTFAEEVTPEMLTAGTIVNRWGEESIADVLYGWGEERFARRIAKAIVQAREVRTIETSKELGEIIANAVPGFYRRGKTHPATKSFQALRIAVNDEIGALKEGLEGAWNLLTKGGRIAVISFHSVEDREVKRMMQEWVKRGEAVRITKSPIRASRDEILANPRARSAKLRVIEKK